MIRSWNACGPTRAAVVLGSCGPLHGGSLVVRPACDHSPPERPPVRPLDKSQFNPTISLVQHAPLVASEYIRSASQQNLETVRYSATICLRFTGLVPY